MLAIRQVEELERPKPRDYWQHRGVIEQFALLHLHQIEAGAPELRSTQTAAAEGVERVEIGAVELEGDEE